MASSAINRNTGERVTAKKLQDEGGDFSGPWECEGCGAEMHLVAPEAGKFKVTVHFRASGGHAANCNSDGSGVATRKGGEKITKRTRTKVSPAQIILRFPKLRRQRSGNGKSEGGEIAEDSYVIGDSAETAAGEHVSNITTLQPVAELYCFNPDKREVELEIERCPMGTMDTLFKELEKSSGYVRLSRKVYFAPIRFMGAELESCPYVVYLHREIRLPQENAARGRVFYQLKLDFAKSSDRTRNIWRKQLSEAVAFQKRYWRGIEEEQMYAFFLGDQDSNTPSRFIIRDHREICLLKFDRDVIANL